MFLNFDAVLRHAPQLLQPFYKLAVVLGARVIDAALDDGTADAEGLGPPHNHDDEHDEVEERELQDDEEEVGEREQDDDEDARPVEDGPPTSTFAIFY